MENNSQRVSFKHVSVLLREMVQYLSWNKAGIRIADLTLGGGGHLRALLEACPEPAEAIAIDQDQDALTQAKQALSQFNSVRYIHSNFRNFAKVTEGEFDRIIVDLGVSSFQLDEGSRGFSFQKDGPLDMRMNRQEGEPVSDWLAHCDRDELIDIFKTYGEEPRARALAEKWVEARQKAKITTTQGFVEAFGYTFETKTPQGKHPLTRVFQALRIYANDEFGSLQDLLKILPEKLSKGGRIGILTFHSLEDREVKWGLRGRLKPVNKKVIEAQEDEMKLNPRARSAKLRVYEKE